MNVTYSITIRYNDYRYLEALLMCPFISCVPVCSTLMLIIFLHTNLLHNFTYISTMAE